MISLLGLNKVVAIYVGPSGYSIVGQFYSAVQIFTTFASGAISHGVIRYTAEFEGDKDTLHKIWKTAGTIALIGATLSSLFIFIFSRELASYFLKDVEFAGVFRWFASSLIFFVLNNLLASILNGKKEIKKYVLSNIAGSLISLFLTVWLTIKFKLYGALVALGVYQSGSFFITLYFCMNTDWFRPNMLIGKVDKKIALELFKYTLMALATALFTPYSHVLIRNYLTEYNSFIYAGYWEAITKFSSAYMLFLTSILSVYYLPRISEIKDNLELKKEIFSTFKLIVPISIVLSVVIYLLKFQVIKILFTEEFYPISTMFFWQLVGDTLKISSWVFSFVFIAKGFVWLYSISEMLFSFTSFGLITFFVPRLGLEGTSVAYAINYLFYMLFIISSLKYKKIL